MFDDLIRSLKKLEQGITIEVPLEPDEKGYIDKECPSKNCAVSFKIHEEDWGQLVRDKEVFCPVCRHRASADHWLTTQQVSQGQEIALAELKREVGRGLDSAARRFNRRQPRNSFISMTMTYKGKPTVIPLPPAAADPMHVKVVCSECGCRYTVIGTPFFCPACGHNSAEETFGQIMEAIQNTLASIPAVQEALTDKDAAEQMTRLLLEKAIEIGVMAFQAIAEHAYKKLPGQPEPRKNAFQNIQHGSVLFRNATGIGYEGILRSDELFSINVYFQERHLLAHRNGIVDADYLKNSQDTRYQEGQRIALKQDYVAEFPRLLEKLVSGISSPRDEKND